MTPTCPGCHSADHTVALLFSCPTHPTNLAPRNMWVAPLQVAQFPAEHLLPRSYQNTLSQLQSSHCSRLQPYCHCYSVGSFYNPTCPDCRFTNNMVAHLFSCPTHHTDLVLRDMWLASLQVAQFLFVLWQDHFIFTSPQSHFTNGPEVSLSLR